MRSRIDDPQIIEKEEEEVLPEEPSMEEMLKILENGKDKVKARYQDTETWWKHHKEWACLAKGMEMETLEKYKIHKSQRIKCMGRGEFCWSAK